MLAQQTPIAFSGNIPQNYDAFLGPMFFEPYALEMSKRISKLAPANLLELASGTGRLTRMLPASSAENATIIASDINPAMIQFGKNSMDGNRRCFSATEGFKHGLHCCSIRSHVLQRPR